MNANVLEYVLLRLIRRFLFTDPFLLRFGRWIPHYNTNANQADGGAVVEVYERFLPRVGVPLPPKGLILEVGAGATNSVGYAMAERGWGGGQGRVMLFEPFVHLDESLDTRLRRQKSSQVLGRVDRVTSLHGVPDSSVALVLSTSVLEHVRQPDILLGELRRVLAPDGVMLHVVDYRDHFFKYPYHFLLFRNKTWNRWLDPGDLPRWRLGDHVRQFEANAFTVEILESESLTDAFDRVAPRISADFDSGHPHIAVTHAVLAVRRAR